MKDVLKDSLKDTVKDALIVFCKGNSENPVESFILQHVQSDYIHCEIIIGNRVYDYSLQYGKAGKKRWNLADRIKLTESYKKKNIDFFRLAIPEKEVDKLLYYTEYYFHNHSYDETIATNKVVAFTEAVSDFSEYYEGENVFEYIRYNMENAGNSLKKVFTKDPEYIRGTVKKDKTICSHFCFRIIKYIVLNYYPDDRKLNSIVNEIEYRYKKNSEYITPGYLYEKFKDTKMFQKF